MIGKKSTPGEGGFETRVESNGKTERKSATTVATETLEAEKKTTHHDSRGIIRVQKAGENGQTKKENGPHRKTHTRTQGAEHKGQKRTRRNRRGARGEAKREEARRNEQ
jgi:hypothetical protein